MVNDVSRFLAVLMLPLLGACGGGGSSGSSGTFSVEEGTFGSNGLAHATPEVGVADLAGKTLAVTVVRFLTDYNSGATRLIASDETLVVGQADGFGLSEEFSLSLAGEELAFTDGTANGTDGREWTALRVTFGEASATTGLYSYSYGAGATPLDSEGVFVAGFEAPKADIAGRNDTAEFAGDWFGYGVLLGGSGQVLATELDGGGTVALTVDFSGSRISGRLSGSYPVFGDIEASFAGAEIENGGFAAEVRPSCSGACGSDTTMAGRFYGAGAGELSGIIAWDETRGSSGSGGSSRLLSAAGFTARE